MALQMHLRPHRYRSLAASRPLKTVFRYLAAATSRHGVDFVSCSGLPSDLVWLGAGSSFTRRRLPRQCFHWIGARHQCWLRRVS